MSLRQPARSQPAALEATVIDPAPDGLIVAIDSFDGDRPTRSGWEVAGWPPHPARTPAAGDRCLVVPSDTGRVWVVAGDWTGEPAPGPEPWTPDWQTPTLASGWTDYGASDPGRAVGCARSPDGLVKAVGDAARLSSAWRLPATICTLPWAPAGRREPIFLTPLVVGGATNGWARVRVLASGAVSLRAVSNEWAAGINHVSLDGISFWTEVS